ncbi:LacI family transcriptional regulator [Kaistia algarum]|uniref:LacI family DNA-binding transcriptional regulator n=1 Tax=Kaistia algarum TaxID=2083279 RepID=UPI000CE7C29E|nr:LacI family DNA-binding transcriptional regulator [Kaistia algarum]MCX5515794.1 LacI family DNA-binding transcriptional regulator [Kaistia algarum]PPE80832.1 LacI family transcriptional regulator [Kaistia algarum]
MTESGKAAKAGFGATMSEVAALAGVTKMTVSRVLRHPEKVNAETRERVTAAMARIGYVPNRLAGSLTAGSTGLVAAIVPTLRHSIFADTLEGISDVLSEAGLGLFVSSSAYRTDVEESQIRSILERRPDALVLTGLTHTGATRELLRGFGIPVVETWETGDEPVDMAVGFSNREAAHAMTAELIRSGYRRIAFVNGPSESNERARHRAEGYLDAMREAGLSAPPIQVVHDEAAILPETGARAIRMLRKNAPDVDAVFFTSDVFAVGAILACRELGVRVPEQLGIAGFHDLEIGRVVSPTLTTVHVPAMEMGRKAGHMILARLAGSKGASERYDLGFSIISRESSRRKH